MIIFENNSWQTRNDHPNDNWLEEFVGDSEVKQPKYVIDDNSELAKKIKTTSQFTIVEDENGEIVDINAIVDPSVELYARQETIKAKLSEIDELEIRPLAAIIAGTGTDEDTNRLNELEAEKAELRSELSVVVTSLTNIATNNTELAE